ncbi:TonB-dependent receptor [Cognatilysobacter bugurensis]|uniref:Ligand-gated channel n=1 Tax=Cognatilysobacter bugurensis TaxID=543356 RepID=A0A918SXD0_9GAMM|nr:TonB-dependent siderophore receptor [Lysobacter bugurensis]GHA77212.1 ligand-gated channel [Lysobacter bugurensis]
MLRTPSLSPLAGALLLALSLPALAEPAAAATDLDAVRVYGQAQGYNVDATRTATKTTTPLRDVPQAVTIITEDLIDDQAMTSMADVVRYVPGVGMAQGEGHRDAPIFRGNVSTSDFFVDGIRDDVQYLRDLYNVEHIEVLKGANSMIFGRGGSGGVINRVTKQANWLAHDELELQFGSHGRRRGVADFGRPVSPTAAFRVVALYENSDTFRDHAEIERFGINPTFAMRFGENTTATFGYEYFRDDRTTDRGVPSYQLRPLAVDVETFFGDPELSFSDFESHAFTATVEHEFGNGMTLRNATRIASYDKFYQNVYPGAVTSDRQFLALQAYNSGTDRENFFNQTDLVKVFEGAVRHTVLVGAEIGRQETDNVRVSGVFPAAVSPCSPTRAVSNIDCVPVANPRRISPVSFAAATSPDNTGTADIASVYIQDQIEFSPQWQAIVGARWDRFALDYTNNRANNNTGQRLETGDDLFSPRVGLIYKPAEPVSIYASYSVAYTPRAGEQLNGLSFDNRAFAPEKFKNLEIGAKWDIRPDLSATAAAYRLDRTNVVVVSPSNALNSQLIDGQQTEGVELGIAGRVTEAWTVMGGYAYQEGYTLSTVNAGTPTAAIVDGQLAQLPHHSASLWNRYDINPMWGVALGAVYRDEVFATTSNTVVLPSFTRVDAAVYLTLSDSVRMQLNVENLFDKTYYASAHTNDNILPGAPRSVYLGVNLSF